MLTIKTRQTKQCPIERTIHVARTDALRATITEIKQLKTKTTSSSRMYRLSRLESQIGGVGVLVSKCDGSGECYHTLVDGYRYECDCPAGAYSSKPCVHVECCREAVKRGLI